MTANIVFYGHSHIHAVRQALSVVRGQAPWAEMIEAHLVAFHHVASQSGVPVDKLIDAVDGIWQLNPALIEALRARIQSGVPSFLFSMTGGNAHMMLGLMQHPVPFDFVLPSMPDLPVEPAAQILPVDAVRETLRYRIERNIWFTRCVAAAIEGRHFHLESPPPIGSDTYVTQYLDPYFKDRGETVVSPRWLRYKLWRLHSEIVQRACEDNGIVFVPSPQEALDAEGFLDSQGYPGNATHANEWYGARVLAQVASLVSGSA